MSIVISTDGKICFSNSIRNVHLKSNNITDASRNRINRLIRDGKAKFFLSSFNYTVIYHP